METNIIYNEDCLETLVKMEDNSIDLIVTSPPYNKNFYAPSSGADKSWSALRGRQIPYDEYSDSMQPKDYENWQRNIISECIRVLKPSGSLFYNHKDILVGGVLSVLLMSMISMYINRLYGIGGLHLCLIRTIFFQSQNTSIG